MTLLIKSLLKFHYTSYGIVRSLRAQYIVVENLKSDLINRLINAGLAWSNRINGFSVRCIKD